MTGAVTDGSPGPGPLLVGIDVGSQSAKVVVYDPHGGVVAEGRAPLRPPLTPAPGVVEHPGEDLWDALTAACRTAMDVLRTDPRDIAGVGLCGVRFCRALLTEDRSLARPVMSWMDERVSRAHEPADDVRWVCASSGYLTARLTGEVRDSAASYQEPWPVDVGAGDWLTDDTALAAFSVTRDRLPDLLRPGGRLGEVTPQAAAATGLPVGTPVVATANDKAVEALGSGLRRPGDVLLSLGTYVAAMSVGERRPAASSSFWTNQAAVAGEYLYESTGIRRGMWTVSWVRDLFAEGLGARAAETGLDLEDLLNADAAAVPAGSDGLLTVLDWLAPTDAPWRRGAFVGLDERHGPAHFYRSVLEAVAVTMRRHVLAMTDELGVGLERLLVCGGGARSDVMLQILADVLGTPVVRHGGPSAAALGASVVVAAASGVHGSVDGAVQAMVRADRVVQPTREGRAVYVALADVHATLTDALDPVLRRTRDLLG